jgi:hypothetical protein
MKSRTREETRMQGRIANDARLRALGDVRTLELDAAFARLHVLRMEKEEDAILLPGDVSVSNSNSGSRWGVK